MLNKYHEHLYRGYPEKCKICGHMRYETKDDKTVDMFSTVVTTIAIESAFDSAISNSNDTSVTVNTDDFSTGGGDFGGGGASGDF